MALPSITSGQIAIDPVSGVFFFRNGSGALVSSSLNLLQTSNTLVTTEDSIQIAGNVVISGDLTVNGDTTIIKTEVLTVEDKNIELGNVTSPTNTLADGGGITLKGTTNKTFNWSNSTSSWTSSENIDLASGKVYKINGVEVLSANAYSGSAAKWTNARTITLAGDLTGNVSIDGSANVTLTATVAANSVALGTDTTGNYVSSLVAGTGISLSNNSGETATPTITLNAAIDDLTDVTLTTPANGDFFRYNGSVWINDAINLSTDTIGDYVDHLSAGTGITITNNSGEASIPTVSIGQSVATNANVAFNQVTATLVGAVTGNVAGNLTGNVTGNVTGNLTGNVTGNVTGNLTGDVIGTASNSNSWVTSRRITLAGDLSGNVLIKGDADVTLTATVVANAVTLGTDTTGDFVANLVAGTGITITDNTGEGMTPVVKVADSYTTNMVSNIANSASSVSAYADTVGNTAYSNAVSYVNNRTLNDFAEVVITSPVSNNLLAYNGSAWINQAFNLDKLSDVTINPSTVGPQQILNYDANTSQWVNGVVDWSLPVGLAYKSTLGDGTNHTFTITHGLGTRDIYVTCRTTDSPYEVVEVRWAATDLDNATFTFSTVPANESISVTIFSNVSSAILNVTALSSLDDFVVAGNGITAGQYITWNGTKWYNKTLLLDDASDVQLNTVTTGQFLKWNGSNWVNANIPTINTLDDVGDVTITSGTDGDFLKYNGSAWVNDPINLGTDTVGGYVTSLVAGTGITLANNSGEGATPTVTVDTTVIQARVSGISDTEIAYLDGVTSAIQTQLNDKLASSSAATTYAPIASPTFTGNVSGITKTMVGLGDVDNTADTAKPVSTAQQTALDLKANLASPALTGTPTAPTAAAATNTTQIATTAFVRAEVANLVGTASATLDTLGEIATALGNDASLSTTLTNSIALKAPLASPTFTGTVTIPAGASISGFATLASPTFTGTVTLPANTITSSMIMDGTIADIDISSSAAISYSKLNLSNSITTTDLASGAAIGGFNSTLNAQTASYTLQATDLAKLVTIDSASNTVVTVPNILSDGDRIDVLRKHLTGEVTITAGSGVTVYGTPGLKLRSQWSGATLVKLAANTWVVMGDLKA